MPRLLKHQLKILVFLFFLGYAFTTTSSTYAADFSFDYNVYYKIESHGITHVKQQITLTNQTTTSYVQNYSLTVPSEKITNISATDPGGTISPVISQQNNQTIITLPFNIKAVGIYNKLSFVLEYDSSEIAKKQGRIWEIIIPGIEKTEAMHSYNIYLATPDNFGEVSYLSPKPREPNVWALEDHQGNGITAAYGDFQNFSFNLRYHLENTGLKFKNDEITLPPDTNYQKVLISRISQLPQNVTIDADGNWLAQFQLKPKEKKDIVVDGQIYVYANPQLNSEIELTAEERNIYTQTRKYWEWNDEILAKAKELATPIKIYDFVVTKLTYDYSRVTAGIERLGSEKAFYEPAKSVCMEFSDLFVALSRAAGIPAREIHGFAYTTNSRLQPLSLLNDVLHAWPQYYDDEKKQWISVDPTWGNTTLGVDYFSKLDFDHVTFAILGTNSDYPFPAGAFRETNSSKNVFIDFPPYDLTIPQPDFKVIFDEKLSVVSGFKKTINLQIKNVGQVIYRPSILNIVSAIVKDPVTAIDTLIPPYGFIQIPLTIFTKPQFIETSVPIEINLDGKKFNTSVTILPFYYSLLGWTLVAVLTVLFVILRTYAKRRALK